MSEGFIVLSANLLTRLRACLAGLDADEPHQKKAKVEGGGANLVLGAVKDSLRQSLSEAHIAFTLVEGASGPPTEARPCVWTIRCLGADAALPNAFPIGPISIPIFRAKVQKNHLPETEPLPLKAAPTTSSPTADVLQRPVLLVGAGGIGCELLKVLVLHGFKHIEMIDLDTIDATNLNRQFLFNTSDVGKPKADTARAAVLRWFERRRAAYPGLNDVASATPPTVVAYHGNVKDERIFGDAFFARFAAVLNALDNVSARQHVNRMCMKLNLPLFESGTMGYNGQVQPILKGMYECYDCHPRPADQKTFAVCTIHARPTTMVHCVHFAKELYETLFGERSMVRELWGQRGHSRLAGGETPTAPANAGELAYLTEVVTASWLDRARLGDADGDAEQRLRSEDYLCKFSVALATRLFHDKIAQLLEMKASWSTAPPILVDASTIERIGQQDGVGVALSGTKPISRDTALSLEDDIRLFLHAAAACCLRTINSPDEALPFRKEDDLCVDFVAATANLRAHSFHIAEASVEELRTVAGAIVPAIATTNAMVAAGVVQQLLRYYSVLSCTASEASGPACSMVYVRKAPLVKRRVIHEAPLLYHLGTRATGSAASSSVKEKRAMASDRFLMYSVAPSPPNPSCQVCARHGPPTVQVAVTHLSQLTLGAFVKQVLEASLGMESPSVVVASRIVYEAEDYEDLVDEPLSQFGAASVSFLVDALNKSVEWCVVVSEKPATEDPLFDVSDLDVATATEAALVAAQESAAAADEEEWKRASTAAQAPQPEEGDTLDCAIVLSDDDDGEVAASKLNVSAAGAQDAGDDAEEVIEID